MKKILIIIVAFFVFFIAVVFATFAYSGLFAKVTFEQKEMGPFVVAYMDHVGDYSKIKEPMDEVYEELKSEGIVCTKGVGVYFDDPKKTEKENLKSYAGCLLEGDALSEVSDLQTKMKIYQLEKGKFAVSSFPYKNTLSIIIGVMRVYPKMSEYISENKLNSAEIVEIYDMENQVIFYLMPIR